MYKLPIFSLSTLLKLNFFLLDLNNNSVKYTTALSLSSAFYCALNTNYLIVLYVDCRQMQVGYIQKRPASVQSHFSLRKYGINADVPSPLGLSSQSVCGRVQHLGVCPRDPGFLKPPRDRIAKIGRHSRNVCCKLHHSRGCNETSETLQRSLLVHRDCWALLCTSRYRLSETKSSDVEIVA